ncbi:two-component regulator propeller domain-containing protein [Chitinophagaceae bacterium LWZ2-11]
MSTRLFFLFTLLFLSFSVLAQSDNFSFHKLDIYTGLSNNQVRAILKDKNGFMWFGTVSGLDRYDGYSFKFYRNTLNNNSSGFNNSIDALYELPGDKIWVKSVGTGSSVFNLRSETFETNAATYLQSLGLPAGNVSSIIKGNAGRYWFIYDNIGLYLYSSTDKTTKKINIQEAADDVKETNDGQLWIVYHKGLIQKYSIAGNKVLFSSEAILKLKAKSDNYNFIVDNDGDLWLWSYTNGIFLFYPQTNTVKQFTETSTASKLSSNLITQIIQDDNGLIWTSTDHGGITLINKKNNYKVSYLLNDPLNNQSLSQNSIISMYKDNAGLIWLGTYKNGVNYFVDNNIVKFQLFHHKISNPDSIQFDDINCFVEDKNGNIWIGTNGGGLIYFDRKKNRFKQFLHGPGNKNSITSNVVVSLCIDHDGLLWIGTFFGGLCSFDGSKFTDYRHIDGDSTSLSNNNVWAVCEDGQQNLWVGTLSEGLNIFNKKTKKFIRYTFNEHKINPATVKYISVLSVDRNGNLWVGTTSGIIVLDKNKTIIDYYSYSKKQGSLSDNNVLGLTEDSKGRFWVATRNGLNLFDEQTKSFKVFTVSDGLPDNTVFNVLEDKNHTLWISTPKGLCNATPEIKGNDLTLSVINYNEINGLQNFEFNEKAAFKNRAGELFFGGPSGFNIIDPDKIKKVSSNENITFTGLQILNKVVNSGDVINNRVVLPASLSYLEEINLKYKEDVFTIEFASTGFMHGKDEKYAYMMEGFNTDWLYTTGSKHSATYTNLAPGHYIFKVKSLGSNGTWSEVKILKVNIQPPFWRTTIAYIIYLLLIAASLWIIRKITLERIHMRYEVAQQKKEVERVHEMEQVKTKFFTNVSHEFRTPLSLILAPLDKLIDNETNTEKKQQLNLVQRNAGRLQNLVNQLLDFRKMEVGEVKMFMSIGDIVSYCKDIADSFTDISEKKKIAFTFSSNVDELEIYFDRDKIEKILFNLISNAFKYTFDYGKVSLKLIYNPPQENEADGTLAMEVADSGIGIPADKHEMIFERFYQTEVPASMMNQGMGIGLAITKEFVKSHGGIISVKSEVDKGTCFTVLLPARKICNAPPDKISTVTASSEEMDEPVLEEKVPANRKTILLVEDNEDLRFYLKDNLRKIYNVEEAVNGQEGWEKVKALNPDLIVSDIMMPVMDGIEMSRKIKSEIHSAHIPIILLTAMGGEEKQLEGYQIGVNDYIKKPFVFDILASRIKNLIAQQKLLQKKFHKQIEVNPSEVTVTSIDEKFLKDALEIVEKHIDDSEFSVEDFSKAIFMNRVTLYRKIQSLTGKTPTEFIRSIRLKRAAQLLQKSGMSIAAIAWEVGFGNPKKFAKQFKEEFEVTPSQYALNRKNDV